MRSADPTQAMDGARWVAHEDAPGVMVFRVPGEPIRGWILENTPGCWRGYAVLRGAGPFDTSIIDKDHPTEPAARAWVEARVRERGERDGP